MAMAWTASPAFAVPQVEPARGASVPAAVAPVAPRAEAPARRHHAKGDPLEGFNRAMFAVHQALDGAVFRPVAKAYEKIVPKLIRAGLRHFFSNMQEPVVFVNDVLQLKPKRAITTFGRFVINSTVGIGGVLDVAKTHDFRLPHHDNGFGNTLGRYGIGPGPYLFIPLLGPSDLRDFAGGQAEDFGLRLGVGSPFDRAEYVTSHAVITGLDERAESDGELAALLGGAIDPYATLRSAYLQDRAATVQELRHGSKAATIGLDDPLTDPGGEAVAPADTPVLDAAPPVMDTRTTPPPPVALPHS